MPATEIWKLLLRPLIGLLSTVLSLVLLFLFLRDVDSESAPQRYFGRQIYYKESQKLFGPICAYRRDQE